MNIYNANSSCAESIANIVATANKDVAIQFGLNQGNNPKHPSFYTKDWVFSDFSRGEEYFLYSVAGEDAGCVAFEQPNPDVAYLNRLSVLPDYRQQGIGEQLVYHVFGYAEKKGVSEISIGIIAKHTRLKNWYAKLGFVENGMKEFPHLPFDVLFMKYALAGN
uniref:Acetyltransferase n=1 Tax=uncultured Thiotrichaceae bacterium TaxID=298394 RepID=A0A6S6SBK4_9GAMM|nr:MAG: Acetyltransferase [uncultured Thiotrichaceae bacterium]